MMKRRPLSRVILAAAAVSVVLVSAGKSAQADIPLLEKDGWSVWTSGRSAAHFQYITGQGAPAPSAAGVLITGFGSDAAANSSNDVATARIRSGWVGAQLNFGVANQLTPNLKAKAYFSLNVADITNDREKTAGKGIDFREAWSSLEGSFGTIIFGRAISIFGTALAGSVYMYSYGDGVGHPCTVDGQAITCGPVNAGAIFPGFNAQVQYVAPKLGGLGLKVGLYDPSLPSLADGTYLYTLRPLPRLEGEVSYELPIGDGGKVVALGQGLWQHLGRPTDPAMPMASTSAEAWGGIAAARVELSGFRVGAGFWGGDGLGTGVPLQSVQAVDPTGKLRRFVGFLAHGNYRMGDNQVGAGVGESMVRQTTDDENTPLRSLIKSNLAFHVVYYRHIGPLVLGAEFMHWISEWHRGEKQALNFMGVGANFLW
jgi:hypothetical protein